MSMSKRAIKENRQQLTKLRAAFRTGDLSLYLGAGVSVGNGLPTWDQLVLAMYFSAINAQSMRGWRPFPNYLFAIAEWHLKRSHEPLDITARRLRKYFTSTESFLNSLRQTLYAGFTFDGTDRFQPVRRQQLRSANPTLDAVAKLCEKSVPGKKGVQAVITENYDSLLEIALGNYAFQPIWNSSPAKSGSLPIYHVHGYVPVEKYRGSTADELIFTEEQYYSATHETYSWSNLVQLQRMSSSIGLMVGLSLADRNLRRLLDAVMRTPLHCENYALLRKPQWNQPADEELDQIHHQAIQYLDRFRNSGVKKDDGAEETAGSQSGIKRTDVHVPGIKSSFLPKFINPPYAKGPRYRYEIAQILKQVERLDLEQQTFVLKRLGVQPIWYSNHDEIPGILAEIYCENPKKHKPTQGSSKAPARSRRS